MEEPVQHLEIILINSATGWHWTVVVEHEGRRKMIAESDQPLSTVSEAAAEAEAAFSNKNIPSDESSATCLQSF